MPNEFDPIPDVFIGGPVSRCFDPHGVDDLAGHGIGSDRIVQHGQQNEVFPIPEHGNLGQVLDMPCQSICVHGDSPGALEMVKGIRSILEQHNIKITPLRSFVG